MKKLLSCLVSIGVLASIMTSFGASSAFNPNIDPNDDGCLANSDSACFKISNINELDVDDNGVVSVENNRIKKVIQDFFDDYEYRIDNADLEGMQYDKYFSSKKGNKTTLNIALIDTMLYQNILSKTNHYSGQRIRELNKSITFNYTNITKNTDAALIDMYIYKTFNYNICPSIESATMDRYLVKMVLENGEWKIEFIDNFISEDILYSLKGQGVDLDDIISINKYKESILSNIIKYNEDKKNESSITAIQSRSSNYNANNAVAYANTYVFSPNPNYFNIEGIGGDCTNFASQVLNEGGGIPEHFGYHGYNNCWFYTSSSNRSTSWAGADYLYDYMHSNNSMINFNDSNWSSVTRGDLIQVSYDGVNMGHSMIVTSIVYSSSGRADLLVTYRSTTNNHKKDILLSTRGSSEDRRYMHISGGV